MNRVTRKSISYVHNHLLHMMWATSGQECACDRAKWQRLAVFIDKIRTRYGNNPWDTDNQYAWERALHWIWIKCDRSTTKIYNRFPFVIGGE